MHYSIGHRFWNMEVEFSIQVILCYDQLVMNRSMIDGFGMPYNILNKISKIFPILSIKQDVFNLLKAS